MEVTLLFLASRVSGSSYPRRCGGEGGLSEETGFDEAGCDDLSFDAARCECADADFAGAVLDAGRDERGFNADAGDVAGLVAGTEDRCFVDTGFDDPCREDRGGEDAGCDVAGLDESACGIEILNVGPDQSNCSRAV